MKKFEVWVKPGAKQEKVETKGEILLVYVKEKPEKGKANKALVRILSDYFSCLREKIKIVKGEKSRKKVVVIEE